MGCRWIDGSGFGAEAVGKGGELDVGSCGLASLSSNEKKDTYGFLFNIYVSQYFICLY